MRRLLIITIVLFAPMLPPVAAGAQCVDNGADHGRWVVKTRSAPNPLPNPSAVDVATVLGWPVPWVKHWNDTELIGAEEGQILHLRGYVRRFGCEADGDYHVEIADSGAANARRVIIEAPDTQPAIRQQLEELLGGPPPKKGRPFNGSNAVPIEVWGWRFLDLDHQSALVDAKTGKKRTMAQLKKGHGHGTTYVGTLWEGHPILRLQTWAP